MPKCSKYTNNTNTLTQANPLDPIRTNLELYKLLLDQLQSEDRIKKQFEKVQEDISNIFDLRKSEKSEPKLKFSLFDPLRNGAARALRMQQVCSTLHTLRIYLSNYVFLAVQRGTGG